MRHWIRSRLPTEAQLQSHRGLRWMGPLLRRPGLWRLNRRSVALGAGIGVFFGFLIPVLQIAGAAVFALALRANLPVAALSTLVSNPFTYAPIGVLAYRTGSALLGERALPAAEQRLADALEGENGSAEMPWWQRIAAIGKPLMLGLAVFAVVGGFTAWALVHAGWTLAVWLKRRRRRPRPPA